LPVKPLDLDKLYKKVSKVFQEKLRDWNEEEHEATKLLTTLLRRHSR